MKVISFLSHIKQQTFGHYGPHLGRERIPPNTSLHLTRNLYHFKCEIDAEFYCPTHKIKSLIVTQSPISNTIVFHLNSVLHLHRQ